MRYLLMLADVLSGRNTEVFTEGGRERGWTGVADGVGYLRNIDLLLGEHTGGLFHADVLYKVVHAEASHLLHLTVQVRAADAGLGADEADVEFAVRDVVVDALHDALHE